MNKYWILSLIYAAVLLAAWGCADDRAPAGTAPADTETQALSEELHDSLPAGLNFDGATVTLYVDSSMRAIEYDADLTGDIVEDAIYARNLAVQERLNVVFEFIERPGLYDDREMWQAPVRSGIMAGDSAYDIVAGYSLSVAKLSTEKLFLNLFYTQYIDFRQPWWSESLVNDLSVGGKLYFASGDISTNMVATMFTVLFNKSLLADYNLKSPYEMVDDGSWTLDNFLSLSDGIYSDLNNSGTKDMDDLFGLSVMTTSIDNLYFSCGMKIVELDDDKIMRISDDFGSAKMAELVKKLCSAFNENDYCIMGDETTAFLPFQNNNAVFSLGSMSFAINNLRNADFDYGAVPTPKWDESQQDYHTTIAYTCSLYAIPKDAADAGHSSAVIEALAVEGYYNVMPVFFETAMKVKYSSDSEAGRMFDIMRGSLNYDLGRVFSQASLDSIPGSIRGMVVSNNPNWASKYESFQVRFESLLEELVTTLSA